MNIAQDQKKEEKSKKLKKQIVTKKIKSTITDTSNMETLKFCKLVSF